MKNLFFVICLGFGTSSLAQISFFEDFNNQGEPTSFGTWRYHTDIYPYQTGWNDIVPGDGYAYLTVDPDIWNDTDPTYPYQDIRVRYIGPGHRLETRMKGAAVPGLVGFIFTYREIGPVFDEIDIELVPDDQNTPPSGHDLYPPNGWTDARFNSWANSNATTYLPEESFKHPIYDANGDPISHMDDEFHIYTIDWYTDKIEFYVDGVFQDVITTLVPTMDSEVIIGFRDLVWAGPYTWTGTRTMVIDYLNVYPVDQINTRSLDFSSNSTGSCGMLDVDYNNLSTGYTSYGWQFEGGSPSTSTNQNPSVNYSTPGTYNTTLIGLYPGGSDTLVMNDYINILPPGNSYALTFDGDGDYVQCGNIIELNGASEFTVEAWVYIDNWESWNTIFGKYGGTNQTLSLETGSQTGQLYASVKNGNNTWGYANNAIQLNTWTHVAMAYDGNAAGNQNRLKLYIDGVQENLTFSTQNIPTSTAVINDNFCLTSNEYAGADLQGRIDEVRIWNVVRTSMEIYNNQCNLSLPQSGLVAYYPVEDCFGNTLDDETGNYNGSLIDNTFWTDANYSCQVISGTSSPSEAIEFYPNPTEGSIKFTSEASFELFDLQGRIIMEMKNPRKEANLSQLPPGTYIIKVQSSSATKRDLLILK